MDSWKNKDVNIKNIHSDYCNDIAKLCKPLHPFGFTYFHHIRIYPDNTRISLTNNAAWTEHYYNKQYYNTPAINKDAIQKNISYKAWASFKNSIVFQSLRELFNIDHGITIIHPAKNHTDYYYFGSAPDNKEILTFYLNHMNLLDRFILYFNNEAKKLISHVDKNRIVLPVNNSIRTTDFLPIFTSKKYDELIDAYLNETTIKQCEAQIDGKNVVLSLRQRQCIQGLREGKTAKEIALDLKLSAHTIQNYIDNTKQKFGCHRKSDLLKKLNTGILI